MAALQRWAPICSTWPSLACLCLTPSIARCSAFPKAPSGGIFVGGFLAAWTSIFIASLAAALELAFSGTSPANIAVPAMALVHSVIGIGEGLITVGALALIYAVRPELIKTTDQKQVGGKLVWVAGLLIAIALAVASPLASTHPDGSGIRRRRTGLHR